MCSNELIFKRHHQSWEGGQVMEENLNCISRQAFAGLLIFVALATLIPALAIPLAFAVVAVTALGVPSLRISVAISKSGRLIARLLHPATLVVLLIVLLLLAIVLPAASAPVAPQRTEGTGIARLRVYPYGDTGDPSMDPDYIATDPDPWVTDSWIITVSGDTATFGINVTNRHSYQAYDVRLRVAVNNLSLLTSMSLTITRGDFPNPQTLLPANFAVGIPSLTNGANWPKHGVYPTPYSNYSIGGIGPLGSSNDTVVISITVQGQFTAGLKVHFDADGWTILDNNRSPIANADPNDTNIRNPNSSDTTVQIPSVSSVVLPAALAGLAYLFVVRLKRKTS